MRTFLSINKTKEKLESFDKRTSYRFSSRPLKFTSESKVCLSFIHWGGLLEDPWRLFKLKTFKWIKLEAGQVVFALVFLCKAKIKEFIIAFKVLFYCSTVKYQCSCQFFYKIAWTSGLKLKGGSRNLLFNWTIYCASKHEAPRLAFRRSNRGRLLGSECSHVVMKPLCFNNFTLISLFFSV